MKISGIENNAVIMKELGTRLQRIRVSISMTQKELAERAGVSLRTVERIENGENVKMDNLLNIMRALGLIQNLDIMIPEYKVLPTEIHDTGKKRERVTGKASEEKNVNEWKWGDER